MTPPAITRRTFVTGAAGATMLAAAPAGASAAAPPAGLRPETAPPGGVGRDGPWVPTPDVLTALPRLLALSSVPGTALAVVEAGRLAWTHGAGVRYLATPADHAGSASAGSNAPADAAGLTAVHPAADAAPDAAANAVTADAVFEAASLGKPVFAWGVLGLADAGALDLDRPLSAYLPLPDVTDAAARRITARHVLSHTTGFPNWRRALGPLVPAFEPGTRFGYSGEGIYYLQRVVEHLTGQPFAAWARDAVLAPLGMRDSSFVWQAAYAARLAEGHASDGTLGDTLAAVGRRNADLGVAAVGKPLNAWTHDDAVRALAATAPRLPPLPNFLGPNAAGTLFTTAADYGRFVAHAVASAAATTARPSAPSTTARGQMFAPQVRVNGALAWGLGWSLEQEPGASTAPGGGWRYAWHWGDNGTTKNFVLADLAAQRAVVVLTNGESGFKVYERLVAAASRRDPAGLLFRLVG